MTTDYSNVRVYCILEYVNWIEVRLAPKNKFKIPLNSFMSIYYVFFLTFSPFCFGLICTHRKIIAN